MNNPLVPSHRSSMYPMAKQNKIEPAMVRPSWLTKAISSYQWPCLSKSKKIAPLLFNQRPGPPPQTRSTDFVKE